MRRHVTTLLSFAPLLAAVLAVVSNPRRADADPAAPMTPERAERCATRLSIAMVGEGATGALATSLDPQSQFDALVADPRFVERFSRYANSEFNRNPGAVPVEDASYYLAKYVLEQNKPWSDMFVGAYDVVAPNAAQPNTVNVVPDPNGLGYFRSRAWMVRYAGNELAGLRIVAAYRILQNTTGLALVATTNAPGADLSANGRQAAGCKGCHFNNWYALDNVASILSTRTGTGMDTQFTPPAGGPKSILGGIMIADDKQLVQALVANEAFDVNVCRLAFGYLYGRKENSCEGPVFDKCVTAFKAAKTIQSALGAVAKDATYCE